MDIDGASLRALREGRFVTQAELAARTGVTEATISRLERGVQRARISTVRKLAAGLGVEPAALLRAPSAGREGASR